MAIWLPSLSALWGEDEAAWTAYLVLQQVCYGVLCLAASMHASGSARIWFLAAMMWFVVQAVDECLMGNETRNEQWERIAFMVYAGAVFLITRRHDHKV